MAHPSRQEQARTLAAALEAGAEEEEDVLKFSLRLVDAFHEMLESGLKGPAQRLEVGDAFKIPSSTKVYWVAWEDELSYWITTADSTRGWWLHKDDELLSLTQPSSARAGKPGTNKDGWAVGDRVSALQDSLRGVVVAVHDRGVLLRHDDGNLSPESNEYLDQHYTKESK